MALREIALDTNIAIEVLNNNRSTIHLLSDFELIYLPVVVCGELLYGAKNSAKSASNLPRYERFIHDCRILNTVNAVAALYADLKKHLRLGGTPIPENDIWIGATCIVYGIPLFTRDRHFLHIPALERVH